MSLPSIETSKVSPSHLGVNLCKGSLWCSCRMGPCHHSITCHHCPLSSLGSKLPSAFLSSKLIPTLGSSQMISPPSTYLASSHPLSLNISATSSEKPSLTTWPLQEPFALCLFAPCSTLFTPCSTYHTLQVLTGWSPFCPPFCLPLLILGQGSYLLFPHFVAITKPAAWFTVINTCRMNERTNE